MHDLNRVEAESSVSVESSKSNEKPFYCRIDVNEMWRKPQLFNVQFDAELVFRRKFQSIIDFYRSTPLVHSLYVDNHSDIPVIRQ